MGNQRKTEGNGKQCFVHCPGCDSGLFSATEVVDLHYKCKRCHRHYLINIKNGSVSIVLISISQGCIKEEN